MLSNHREIIQLGLGIAANLQPNLTLHDGQTLGITQGKDVFYTVS